MESYMRLSETYSRTQHQRHLQAVGTEYNPNWRAVVVRLGVEHRAAQARSATLQVTTTDQFYFTIVGLTEVVVILNQ